VTGRRGAVASPSNAFTGDGARVGLGFWLRWSWRDLRDRWLLVLAIGLTIALGTGAWAGLGSTSAWARETYDRAYADAGMYDLRLRLAEGSYAQDGELATAVRGALGDDLAGVEERLIVPTQVDASTDGRTILVPGRIVGVPVTDGRPEIARLWVDEGRALAAADAGEPNVLLDLHFARHYDLPSSGSLSLAGQVEVDYVGLALAPEYYMVVTDAGGVLAERNFAVVFTSIETARAATGVPGMVNDAVIRLADGASPTDARARLAAGLRSLADLGPSVMLREDDVVHRTLYDDIESDAVFFRVFAALLLGGAALGTFNLTSRVVESQRRQIGVAMALGASTARIAVRPVLVSAEIAVLGVILGVGVGQLLGVGMRGVFASMLPLPEWHTPFHPEIYAAAAGLGFAVPFLAALVPIVRAVRVAPIEAIRSGLTAGGAPSRPLRPVPAPGGLLARMPFRNVQRTPRRTILTALGIGAAVAVLTTTGGTVDTMNATIDRGEGALALGDHRRMTVQLADFLPADATVAAIAAVPEVGDAEPALRVTGSAAAGGERLDLVLELVDMDGGLWKPALGDEVPGVPDDEAIVLAEKALDDLGLVPGDSVLVEHPRLVGDRAVTTVTSRLTVSASHAIPLRFDAYADLALAGRMNLEGIANLVRLTPARGASVEAVQRALFGEPGIASVQPDDAMVDVFRGVVDEYLGILAIAQLVGLALAVAIAFNSATISYDERVREHATMFAFGTPVRRVVALSVVEHALIGLVATVIGLALGRLLLGWLIASVLPTTFPDFGFVLELAPGTALLAVACGVVAVGLAPVLGLRRLVRMDVPGALRLVE
jgi:putative ABC transport system permease protein